jgi:hypothetical protein
MAKQPKKSKKPKKKTPDLLAKTLEVLTTLDRETAKAIRLLCIANQVPIDKVVLKRKEFEVSGKAYHAKLSQFQWDQILAVAGGGNLAVLVKVRDRAVRRDEWRSKFKGEKAIAGRYRQTADRLLQFRRRAQ